MGQATPKVGSGIGAAESSCPFQTTAPLSRETSPPTSRNARSDTPRSNDARAGSCRIERGHDVTGKAGRGRCTHCGCPWIGLLPAADGGRSSIMAQLGGSEGVRDLKAIDEQYAGY